MNEHTTTRLGLQGYSVVHIDLNGFEKEALYEDAILRGRCASGELVVVAGLVFGKILQNTARRRPSAVAVAVIIGWLLQAACLVFVILNLRTE